MGAVKVILERKGANKNAIIIYAPAISGKERMSCVHPASMAKIVRNEDTVIFVDDHPGTLKKGYSPSKSELELSDKLQHDPAKEFMLEVTKRYAIEMGADWVTSNMPFLSSTHHLTLPECLKLIAGKRSKKFFTNTSSVLILSHSTLAMLPDYVGYRKALNKFLNTDPTDSKVHLALEESCCKHLATNLVRMAGAYRGEAPHNAYTDELLAIIRAKFQEKSSEQPFMVGETTVLFSDNFKPIPRGTSAQIIQDIINALRALQNELRSLFPFHAEEEFDLAINDYLTDICQQMLRHLCKLDNTFLKSDLADVEEYLLANFSAKMTLMGFINQCIYTGKEVNTFDLLNFERLGDPFEAICAKNLLEILSFSRNQFSAKQALVEVQQTTKPERVTLTPSKEMTLAYIPNADFNATAFFAGSTHNQPKLRGYKLYSTLKFIKDNEFKRTILYVADSVQTQNMCPINHAQEQAAYLPHALTNGLAWFSYVLAFAEQLGLKVKRLNSTDIADPSNYTFDGLVVVFHSDIEKAFPENKNNTRAYPQILDVILSLTQPGTVAAETDGNVCATMMAEYNADHIGRVIYRHFESMKWARLQTSKSTSDSQSSYSSSSTSNSSSSSEPNTPRDGSELVLDSSENLLVSNYREIEKDLIESIRLELSKKHTDSELENWIKDYVNSQYFKHCPEQVFSLSYEELFQEISRLKEVMHNSFKQRFLKSKYDFNHNLENFIKYVLRYFAKQLVSNPGKIEDPIFWDLYQSSLHYSSRESAVDYCVRGLFPTDKVFYAYPGSATLYPPIFAAVEGRERQCLVERQPMQPPFAMPAYTSVIIQHERPPAAAKRSLFITASDNIPIQPSAPVPVASGNELANNIKMIGGLLYAVAVARKDPTVRDRLYDGGSEFLDDLQPQMEEKGYLSPTSSEPSSPSKGSNPQNSNNSVGTSPLSDDSSAIEGSSCEGSIISPTVTPRPKGAVTPPHAQLDADDPDDITDVHSAIFGLGKN